MRFYHGRNPYAQNMYSPYADNIAGGLASLGSKIPQILNAYQQTIATQAQAQIAQQRLVLQQQQMEAAATERQRQAEVQKGTQTAIGEYYTTKAEHEKRKGAEGYKPWSDDMARDTFQGLLFKHGGDIQNSSRLMEGIGIRKRMTPYQEKMIGLKEAEIEREGAQQQAMSSAMTDPNFETDPIGTFGRHGVPMGAKDALSFLKDKMSTGGEFNPRSLTGRQWLWLEKELEGKVAAGDITDTEMRNILARQAVANMGRATRSIDPYGQEVITQKMAIIPEITSLLTESPAEAPSIEPGSPPEQQPGYPSGEVIPKQVEPRAMTSIPSNITITPGSGVKLSREEKKKMRGDLIATQDGIVELEDVLSKIKPEDFQFASRAKHGVAQIGEKFGIARPSKDRARFYAVKADIQRGLNLYRKMITGAQAAVEEIERFINPSMPNFEDDTYSTFVAKAADYIRDVKRIAAIKEELLAKGAYSDEAYRDAVKALREERDIEQGGVPAGFEEVIN